LLTGVPPPPVDYYVVLDFEATCWENERSTQQEIIELPSVLVDARRGVVVSEFQRYVRPVLRPQLSDFCTTLTGIPQAVVSEGKKFADCLTDYVAWLRACGLAAAGTSGASFLFVTCGDWDLKTMLPLQLRNLTSAEYDTVPAVKAAASLFGRWVNIKFALSDNAPRVGLPPRYRSGGMDGMLSALKLPLVGFHHSGIDDCRNIAQILIALLRAGATVTATAAAPGQGLAPPASTIDRATAPAFVSMEATSSLAPVSPPAQAELDALRVRLQAARGVTVAQPTRAAASAAAAAPPRPEAGQRTARDAVGGAAAAAPSDAGAAAPAPAALAPAVAVDTTRDVATEILAAAGMTDVASAFGIADAAAATAASVRVSRTLSSCLRHNALEWGLPLTENGFVPVEALLAHPRIKSNRVTLPQLAAVCKFSDKGRYCLAIATPIPGAPATTANTFIRANQGHSIPNVLVDLTPITHPSEAPQLVVHGTYRKAVPLIRASGGLSRMGRLHVHFAQGLPGDQGVISGMRGNAEVLFYLDVARALAAGLPLLRSANGVILTPGFGPEGIVPLELMSAVVDARSRVPIEMD
jgi:2'-phosphotransferase/ERI1 exoribonuclease 3